jgi:hypothetical protein
MRELTDAAQADADGLGRVHVRSWRRFLLLPLILVAVGCGGGGGPGETNPTPSPPPATGTTVPDDLVGQWSIILTYVPAYYTGIVPNSDFIGSLGIALYLQPNGSYQFDLRSAASYFGGNCFRTTEWSETGRASIAGAAITFTSVHATNMIMDSCGAARYVDPAPTGTATYTMTREQDQAGWPRLRLRMPSGEDMVLERCRTCG